VSYDDIEPLETSAWLRQLRKLAAAPPECELALGRSLRQGFYLAQLTPRPLRQFVRCNLPEVEFERVLEDGELLTAALALVGDRLNYSLTRLDGGNRVEAAVWFPNEMPWGTLLGSDAPSAIFQAWLQCLATLDDSADFSQLPAGRPIPRRSQSELRPRSTEH
jgi:hypothetical protein